MPGSEWSRRGLAPAGVGFSPDGTRLASAGRDGTVWLADDGAKLKAESFALFGRSLDIALRVAAGDPAPADVPFKSFHYYEGVSEKVERAQLVSETCERQLLKTLRATFLSVPTMRTDCAEQTPASATAPAPKQEPADDRPAEP